MSESALPRKRPGIADVLGERRGGAAGLPGSRAWRWASAAVGLALLVLLARWIGSGGEPVRYVTEPVTRGGLIVVVTATGSVQPTEKVDVSSELSGTVRRVLVDYNSIVTAGQVLAELDTDKLEATANSARARLTAAKAMVGSAKATLAEKKRELSRKGALARRQIVTDHDLDLAKAEHDRAVAALESAEADVGVAEAELRLDEANLAKAVIRAPIAGIVLERNVDPGQTVAATFQAPVLFSIAQDLKHMELRVDVDEADVGVVEVGQKATFGVDAFPDRRFPATIRDVRYAPETIQGVVTYKAVLDIDNSEMVLRPGMTATAEIRVTEIAEAVLVPNAALRYAPALAAPEDDRNFLEKLLPRPPRLRPAAPAEESGPSRSVWVLEAGVPKQVPIVIGASDGSRTEVRSGALEAGQLLIVEESAGSS